MCIILAGVKTPNLCLSISTAGVIPCSQKYLTGEIVHHPYRVFSQEKLCSRYCTPSLKGTIINLEIDFILNYFFYEKACAFYIDTGIMIKLNN